jgi:hypothetical protein
MTRFTMDLPAGAHMRFAEDVRLPAVGKMLKVNMADETQCEGRLVQAERVSDQYLRVTIEIEGDVPDGLMPRPADFSFKLIEPSLASKRKVG